MAKTKEQEPMTKTITLRGTDHWVSCSREVNESVAEHRHIVARGHLTTVCGATGMPPEIWRGNKTKPRCPQCMARYGTDENRSPLEPGVAPDRKAPKPPKPKSDLTIAFEQAVRAAQSVGLDTTGWRLDRGSKTMGVAYALSTGRTHHYLGRTAREAERSLDGMRAAWEITRTT